MSAEEQNDVWVPPPWEPPIDGTEAEHLVGALGRMRATLRWKADGLDEAGLRHRLPSSNLSLGGLLLHLAMGEDYYLTTKLRGEELVEPWRSLGHDGTDEWEFTTEAFSAAETYAVFDEAVVRNTARIEAALAEGAVASTSWPTSTTATATTRGCGACSSTCWRSTAATPATPTCCARRSTAGSARTRTADWTPTWLAEHDESVEPVTRGPRAATACGRWSRTPCAPARSPSTRIVTSRSSPA